MSAAQQQGNGGAQLSARAQEVAQGFLQNSARFFENVGRQFNTAVENIPTQTNKETRAARKIQTAWRSCAARGHFHEERGAVLMLQSAQRRMKAQKAAQYKKALKYWAATVIQERWRRHKLRQKHKEAMAAQAAQISAVVTTPKKSGGLVSKIVKSLSFSRRKKPPAKPAMPDDISAEDLISARGNNPDAPAMLLGQPLESPAATPTGGGQPKKRSLSFTRRKKAAEAPKQAV